MAKMLSDEERAARKTERAIEKALSEERMRQGERESDIVTMKAYELTRLVSNCDRVVIVTMGHVVTVERVGRQSAEGTQ